MSINTYLPAGYTFVDYGVNGCEVVDLFKAVHENVDSDTPEQWDIYIQKALAVIGVRDYGQTLAGVGFLSDTRQKAEMHGLAVHPDHQHQGIGRALVGARLMVAQDLGVKVVETMLSPKNSLAPLYRKLGFKALSPMQYVLELENT